MWWQVASALTRKMFRCEGDVCKTSLKRSLGLELFLSKHTVICRTAVIEPSPSLLRDFFSSGRKILGRKGRETSFILISFRSSQLALESPMAREAAMGG